MNSSMPLLEVQVTNYQFLAALLQECGRKLWPSSRQSAYQGCGNLAQLTLSPLRIKRVWTWLNLELCSHQPHPATSHTSTKHAPLGHHDEGWKGFGKDDLLSRLWCAFTNSWSQQRWSDTQGWGSGVNELGCGKSQILDTVSWLFLYSECACLFFSSTYPKLSPCLELLSFSIRAIISFKQMLGPAATPPIHSGYIRFAKYLEKRAEKLHRPFTEIGASLPDRVSQSQHVAKLHSQDWKKHNPLLQLSQLGMYMS